MIHLGDCIEVMAGMPADSVDAVVTDPPYNLAFMGREWDRFSSAASASQALSPAQIAATTPAFKRRGKAITNDGSQHPFQAWCEAWGREALRVTKPGGYLLAFGGCRTHHRLVCGLEDAGWIIRDELTWVYASGFPKGKANLKPAHEPIVLARKPGPLRPLQIDATRISTEGEEIHAPQSDPAKRNGVVGTDLGITRADREKFQAAQRESIERTQTLGRWPSNLLLSDPELFDVANPGVVGSGAHPHGAGFARIGGADTHPDDPGMFGLGGHETNGTRYGDSGGYSRFFRIPEYDHGYTCAYCTIDPRPSWPDRKGFEKHMAEVHPGQPFEKDYPKAFLIPKADRADREPVLRGQLERGSEMDGSPVRNARCGKCGRVQFAAAGARCSCSEPEWVASSTRENAHPTVKPTDLMRHLVRLVTPSRNEDGEPGVVLDCFLGSGSTAIACELEGIRWIGIEQDESYVRIAEARLNGVQRGLGLAI